MTPWGNVHESKESCEETVMASVANFEPVPAPGEQAPRVAVETDPNFCALLAHRESGCPYAKAVVDINDENEGEGEGEGGEEDEEAEADKARWEAMFHHADPGSDHGPLHAFLDFLDPGNTR